MRPFRQTRLRWLTALPVFSALFLLAACQNEPGESFIRRPLRSVDTEQDRLIVACIRNDPFFNSEECRDFR